MQRLRALFAVASVALLAVACTGRLADDPINLDLAPADASTAPGDSRSAAAVDSAVGEQPDLLVVIGAQPDLLVVIGAQPDLLGVIAPPPDLLVAAVADLSASSSTPDLASSVSPYPAGPYGGAVGDVVPNVSLPGYWSPTKTTGLATSELYATITFDQMRRSGARYALIHMVGYN